MLTKEASHLYFYRFFTLLRLRLVKAFRMTNNYIMSNYPDLAIFKIMGFLVVPLIRDDTGSKKRFHLN